MNKGLEIPEVKRLLGKLRGLVGVFKHSYISSQALKEKEKLLDIKNLQVIQDVATRWNSALYMTQCLLQLMPAVYGVLYADPAHKHLIPTDSDQKLLEELVTVLAFEEITRTSSSEKVPTVGIILPTVQVFFQLLEPNDTDLSAIKKVKQAIKADLSSRYQKEDTQMFLSVCSFLDPRFKSLPWPTEEKRQEVHAKVKEEMHRISVIPVKIKSEVVETPDPDPEKKHL